MAIHSAIVVVSLVIFGLAYLALVIAGFKRNVWWGTGILLLMPIAIVPFVFVDWRRAKYGVGLGVLGAAAFGLAMVVQVATERDTVVERPDLGYRFLLPKAWHERTGEMRNAELHVSQLLPPENFAVIKAQPDVPLGESAAAACADLAQRAGGTSTETRPLTLNGAPARECSVEACKDGDCAYFVATAVRGPARVVCLLAWTGGRDARDRKGNLLKVRDSFAWTEAPGPDGRP